MDRSDGRPALLADFNAWARISAQLLRRPAAGRIRLLRDRGVAEQWREADAHWFETLVADIEAGQLERVEVYAEICAEALRSPSADGQLPPSPIDALEAAADGDEPQGATG